MNTRYPLSGLSFIVITILLLLSVTTVVYAEDAYTAIYLSELRQAHAPRLLGDRLLFTYAQSQPLYAVAVAFSHQNYTRLYYLEKNEYDVFLFRLPLDTIDPDLSELQYLYIVDGIWINDPLNLTVGSDFAGKRYSLISLPRTGRPVTSPLQRDEQTVFFFDPAAHDAVRISDITGTTYYPEPSQPLVVFVAGSFNGWDPGSHPLEQVEQQDIAYYTLSIPVSSGDYRYYFVVNGVPVLDPLNENIAVEPDGRRTSFFEVP